MQTRCCWLKCLMNMVTSDPIEAAWLASRLPIDCGGNKLGKVVLDFVGLCKH